MRTWPPITEPALLERLALDDEQFFGFIREMARALGRRVYEPALLERALDYPWARPARSYVLRGEDVELLDDLDPAARRPVVETFAAERHPVVAIGSNAAPSTLAAKFAHFPDEADRTVLVLAGYLHGFDVGAAASPTGYGVMPAALFASPGTAVRAAVLWVTATQFTLLTWSELSYRLGRLEGAHFGVDEADMEIDDLFAYVSRFGAFCVDGAPVALAAIPATGRTAAALTQEQLLDVVARLVIGPDLRAEDLVRAIFENMAEVFIRVPEAVWPRSQPLSAQHWTLFPAARKIFSGER